MFKNQYFAFLRTKDAVILSEKAEIEVIKYKNSRSLYGDNFIT